MDSYYRRRMQFLAPKPIGGTQGADARQSALAILY